MGDAKNGKDFRFVSLDDFANNIVSDFFLLVKKAEKNDFSYSDKHGNFAGINLYGANKDVRDYLHSRISSYLGSDYFVVVTPIKNYPKTPRFYRVNVDEMLKYVRDTQIPEINNSHQES